MAQTKFHDVDGNIYITRVLDADPVLEYAKAMSNEGFHGADDARFVATIPGAIIEHWCHTKGITHKEWMGSEEVRKRFLNDPDYANFRIWKGKV